MAIGSMTTNSTVDIIDKTLRIENAPADAKATGDALAGKLGLHDTADDSTRLGGYSLRLQEETGSSHVLVQTKEGSTLNIDYRNVAEIAGLNGVSTSGKNYVRFTDGTQICWMSTGAGIIAANTIYTGTLTYPLPFTSTPVFLVSLRGNPANNDYKSIICGSNGPAGIESHEYYICNNAATSASPGISIVVIGRWK